MLKDQIKSILDNWDYEKGFKLYQEHGTNKFLKSILASGPDSYNTEKLQEELYNLMNSLKEDNSPSLISAKNIPSDISINNAYNYSSKLHDHYLNDLDKERVASFQEMSGRHSILTLTGDQLSDEERKEHCQIIRSLDEVNKNLWKKRDEYLATGKIPEELAEERKIEIPSNPLELIGRRNTNRAYINKNKKRLEKESVKDKEAILAEIERRELENLTIQKLIDEQTSTKTSDQAL